MLLHKLVLGQLQTNCYILADEETKEAVVIDVPDQADVILDFLKEKAYIVRYIILTHGHFDHMLALKEVREATGAPLLVHENCADFLKDTIKNLCHYTGVLWEATEADRYLKEGDIVAFGSQTLHVLHTPGHTADCICLLAGDILISGDTLFWRSVGRTDHPTGSLEEEINSIKEKLLPLPADTKVYPGHGPMTTIGDERKENPYLQ